MKDKEHEQPSSSNSPEASMQIMMKIIERLMERLTMDNRPPPRRNQEQQNRNQNFRRPLPPPKNQIIPEDQQIRQQFLDNFVDEEGGKYPMENQNHHFDDIDFGIYFAQE